ncbi:hypothetical protein ACWGE0_42880 [Lentzea sp. NPDC054927]
MNSAPWWLVLVAAALTGVFALAGSWLTGHSALKRQREELDHERILEREKRLHDRRLELYAELIPVVDRIMTRLRVYDRSRRNPERQDPEALRTACEGIESDLDTVRRSLFQVLVVSEKAVRALVDQFIWEAAQVLARLKRGQALDLDLCDGEVAFAANHLIWEMRIEVGVTTREDLDEFEARERY